MTPDDFRALALGLDGAIERAHMGHPDFRANGRIFATLHADDEWGMVKLAPEEQKEFIRSYQGTFVPSSGAWGRQGCTNVRLATVDTATLRTALLLACEKTLKAPSRRQKRPSGRSGRRLKRSAQG